MSRRIGLYRPHQNERVMKLSSSKARVKTHPNRHIGRAISLLFLSLMTSFQAFAAIPSEIGQWGPVLDWGVQAKHMILLPTGEVLVWSTGEDARVWDPSTDNSFTPTPLTQGDIHCASQATLADGRIIIGGGQGKETHQGIHINALFDPFTKTWTTGADMVKARWYATLLVLNDGRVLITTGDDEDKNRVLEPEIYDPIADTWTLLTGASRADTLYTFMYQLPNGDIFQAGPGEKTWFLDLDDNGSWSQGPRNTFGASGYSVSSAMYRPGKILNSGGGDPAVNNASVINMNASNPQWRDIAPMNFKRRRHDLTILPDGTVLAVGGTGRSDNDEFAVMEAELFDPDTEAWTVMDAMDEARMYHSSTVLLPDGRIVAAGGEGGERRKHAQVFSPPYLFKGPRPTITSAPESTGYGSTFSISTPDASDIQSVVLLRSAGATHTYDQSQRYVPLSFRVSGQNLIVDGPVDANEAAPGYFMLFVVNSAGVPAIAPFVRIAEGADLVPGSIRGKVSNASGTPVVGASVSYVGGATVTDDSGIYRFDDVTPGTQTLQVAAQDYGTTVLSVLVTGGIETVTNFTLARSGTVNGHVEAEATLLPIAGANIAYPGGSATTDAAGNFTINDVPEGLQSVTATAVGFEGQTLKLSVVAGSSVFADFHLHPGHTVIEGEVLDASLQPIEGATVSYSNGSVVTDFAGFYLLDEVPEGTITVTASAPGYISQSAPAIVITGFETTLDFALIPDGPAQDVYFPAHDSKVKSSSPTKNYNQDSLRARFAAGGTTWKSYLQFNVTGLSEAPASATLRLRATDGSNDGGSLYALTETFDENTVTYSNAPACGGVPIASAGAVATGDWVEFNVTSQLQGSGTYGWCIQNNSTNSAFYSSKEGLAAPELVIERQGGGPRPTGISGVIEDSRTRQQIPGVTVSYGSESTQTDNQGRYRFDEVVPGTYTFSAGAVGYAQSFNTVVIVSEQISSLDFSLDPITGPQDTFLATHDSKVKSSSPTKNYNVDNLRVRFDSSGIIWNSYVQFNVTGLSRPPISATLRLRSTNGTNDGGSLYALAEPFDENTITFSNAPACGGTLIASAGEVNTGDWVEFDVTSSIGGSGSYGFCLSSTSSNSGYYSSSEGADPPQLTIVADNGSGNGCTLDSECNDGLFCNGVESCSAGICVSGDVVQCNDGVSCTVDVCDESTDSCTNTDICGCTANADCNDGIFCNGEEVCNQGACQAGAPPVCDDGESCTMDSCDIQTDSCNFHPMHGTCENPNPGPSPTMVETQTGSGTGVSTLQTAASLTAGAGDLYIATIATKPNKGVTSVDGLGLTWQETIVQCGARSQTGVAIWVAQGAPTGSGNVNANLAGAANSAVLTVVRYTDVSATAIGNVSGSNTNGLSGACGGGTDANAWSQSLTIANAGATAFIAVANRHKTHTAEGFEVLSSDSAGSGGNTAGLVIGEQIYDTTGEAALSGTFAGTVDWAVAAIEIVPAADTGFNPDLPPVPVPAENPITEEKRILGKILFWEEQLSSNDTMACGTCHRPFSGSADPRIGQHPGPDGLFGNADDINGSPSIALADTNNAPIAHPIFGFDPQVTNRAAPIVIGSQWAHLLLADGRAGHHFHDPLTGETLIAGGAALENQAVIPPLSTSEMANEGRTWSDVTTKLEAAVPLSLANNLPADVAARLINSPSYPDLFEDAFGDPAVTPARLAFAIATYERTLVPDQTPWDLFMAGDATALTANQQLGWEAFDNSLCASCHLPPLFTAGHFHNIGVRPPDEDLGRQAITGLESDRGKFKTPTLRNAALKGTFMHNGRLTSMGQALDFYLNNRSDQFQDNLDPMMPLVDIPEELQLPLLDFLENGLTDPRVANEEFPFDRPTLSTE